MMATAPTNPGAPFASLNDQVTFIIQTANRLGLDPAAVLAVASQEGLGAGPGDNNTSFGPFQLHFGGRYPASQSHDPAKAEYWANSPAGIYYALSGIKAVVGNRKGFQAIDAQVRSFENPARPDPEVAAAERDYQTWVANVQGIHAGTGAPAHGTLGVGTGNPTTQAAIDAGKNVYDTGKTVVDTVPKFLSFVASWRFAEIVGGFLLLLVGVALVARQFGVGVPGLSMVNPLASKASAAAGPISEAPRRAQRRAGFEPQSPERDRREARAARPSSTSSAAGDIPF